MSAERRLWLRQHEGRRFTCHPDCVHAEHLPAVADLFDVRDIRCRLLDQLCYDARGPLGRCGEEAICWNTEAASYEGFVSGPYAAWRNRMIAADAAERERSERIAAGVRAAKERLRDPRRLMWFADHPTRDARLADVMRMRAQGLKHREIADRIGVSKNRVSQMSLRAGWLCRVGRAGPLLREAMANETELGLRVKVG